MHDLKVLHVNSSLILVQLKEGIHCTTQICYVFDNLGVDGKMTLLT